MRLEKGKKNPCQVKFLYTNPGQDKANEKALKKERTLHSTWNEQKNAKKKRKCLALREELFLPYIYVYKGARQIKFKRVLFPSDYLKVQMKPLIIFAISNFPSRFSNDY